MAAGYSFLDMLKAALSYCLVDDHALLIEGLKKFLSTERPHWKCQGAASSLGEAQVLIERQKPDLVLVDHKIGEGQGLELIQSLSPHFPASSFILVSQLETKGTLKDYLQLGVLGVVSKMDPLQETLNAIESVREGKTYFSPSFKGLLESISPTDLLTPREISVVKLITLGKTNKDVALELSCSDLTVKTHKSNIMRKLNLRNSVELSVWAIKNSLLGTE